MQTRETAARQLRTLAGEAWGNVEDDKENAADDEAAAYWATRA